MRLVWKKWAEFPLRALSSGKRRPVVTTAALTLGLLATSAAPGSLLAAGAETPLEAARAEVAAATEKVEALNVEIAAAQGRADAATAAFWEQQETVYLLESTIADLETAVAELDERRQALKEEVQRIAIDRYMEPVNFESVIDADALNAKMRADALASLVTGTSEDAIEELREVSEARTTSVTDLQERLATRDAAAAAAIAAGEDLTEELAGLDERRGELLGELADLESQLDRLEAAEAERVAAVEEAARLEAERERAEAAAALAAEIVEAPPTPEPTPSAFEPAAGARRTPGDAEDETTDDGTDATEPGESAGEDQPSTEEQGGNELSDDTALAEGTEPPVVAGDEVVSEDATDESSPLADAGAATIEAATSADGSTPPPVTATSVPQPTPTPQPTPIPTPEPVPEPTQTGPIVCPLDGPFSHIDDYGAPRPGGRSHQGNDLMAASGTPVLAVVSGQLEHKFGNVGGYTARIKADDGGWYYFAHLSAYENQGAGWVEAGTVIGYVGNTGDAIHTPPHLHFEMHPNGYGNPINPYSAVVASC